MDLSTGAVFLEEEEPKEPFVWADAPKRVLRSFF
jgi:amino acid transporter